MFADRAKIYVRSGKGGDGHVSFRREKYVPSGGPDGGDGGLGGDVIFVVDEGLNTLIDFRHIRKYKAGDGEEGGKKNCRGKDGEDIIVDESTGRLMYGRRYNEGLHQAIEAKEGVKVERESKTLATVTFQNYFRMYKKLSGMTGTAMTEETEFQEIYKLDVVEIPTNKPIQRIDLPDAIFKTEQGKFETLIEDIMEAQKNGQPVLVGTISIENSEVLSALLK